MRGARPVVASSAGRPGLAKATPDLTAFGVLNNLFNMIGYNKTAAPVHRSKDESYLFWLAWLGHNGARCSPTPTPTARSGR